MKSGTSQKEGTSSSGTATFRFDARLLDSLKEEAEQKRTSLNTLVTQILLMHSEFHTSAAKGGMISMPKSLLVKIIEKLSPQVIQLSEYIASNDLKDTILLMKNEYSANSILDFIESWARVGGYPYRHHEEDAKDLSKIKHSFVLQHDMGERWSLYFVELLKFAFKQVGTDIHFEHTKNTISFQVEI